MLKNRFYIGKIRYKEEFLPGIHDPIISNNLWQKVEAMRFERSNKQRSAGRPATGGGGKLGTSKRYRYYTCDGTERQHGCTAKRTRADIADKQLGAHLQSLTLPTDWEAKIIAAADRQVERGANGMAESIKLCNKPFAARSDCLQWRKMMLKPKP